MPSFKITIDPVGRPKWEGQGFTGTACKDAAKFLERKFEGAESNTEDKPEIYMDEGLQEHETI